MVIMPNKDKELIVYTGAKIPIGKKLYNMIDKVGNKMLMMGTDILPFKAELDIRNGGRRHVIFVAIQCLDYLLNKGE